MNRRQFITTSASVVAGTSCTSLSQNKKTTIPIVDTHQHLWNLDRFKLNWLAQAPPILNHSFRLEDYLKATKGLNVVKAIYLEVDVIPSQQNDEARFVIEISKDPKHPTVAGVISGRPENEEFKKYIDQYKDKKHIKGLRRLMETTPPGFCLQPGFIDSVAYLGEFNKHFEITIQPTQLNDALSLVKRCSNTRFVIDHCGTADPKAFLSEKNRKDATPMHEADQWKADMSRLADQPNTVCKISGIVAHAPNGWTTEHLAPIVNHCLDEFGPDRVMFGGDWPVCLLGARYSEWVNALKEIVSNRPQEEREKLFYRNGMRIYQLA